MYPFVADTEMKSQNTLITVTKLVTDCQVHYSLRHA